MRKALKEQAEARTNKSAKQGAKPGGESSRAGAPAASGDPQTSTTGAVGKKRKAQVLQAVDEVFEDKSLDAPKARDVCQLHVGKCGCSEVLAYLEKLNLPGMVIPEHLEGKKSFCLGPPRGSQPECKAIEVKFHPNLV